MRKRNIANNPRPMAKTIAKVDMAKDMTTPLAKTGVAKVSPNETLRYHLTRHQEVAPRESST